MPGSSGFHTVAGASESAIVTLRGPVRRSRYGASDCRQDAAACSRSAAVSVTCISFSACSKVAGVTGGPAPAPEANVGGAPGVGVAPGAGWLLDEDVSLRQAALATSMLSGALMRNWRRVFMSDQDAKPVDEPSDALRDRVLLQGAVGHPEIAAVGHSERRTGNDRHAVIADQLLGDSHR